jgi:hypothetical protein
MCVLISLFYIEPPSPRYSSKANEIHPMTNAAIHNSLRDILSSSKDLSLLPLLIYIQSAQLRHAPHPLPYLHRPSLLAPTLYYFLNSVPCGINEYGSTRSSIYFIYFIYLQ